MPDLMPDQSMVPGQGLQQAPPPPAVDPEKDLLDQHIAAYGMAVKDGNMDAAKQIHDAMAPIQGRIQDRAQQADLNANPNQTALAGLARGALKVGDTVNDGISNTYGKLFGFSIPHSTDDETDKALLKNREGGAGNMLGQTLATLPVGAAGGALAEGLGAAKLAGPGLARALARYGTRIGTGAAENAASNELTGDDASTGAAAGGAMTAVTGGLGKLAKGIVGKSDAAQRLYEDAANAGKDLFIPISQGGTGPAKHIYQEALPYALGVKTQLGSQSKKAFETSSEALADHAIAPQVDNAGQLKVRNAPVGQTMQQTGANISDLYKADEKNTLGSYAFKPDNFRQTVLDNLADQDLPPTHNDVVANKLEQILNGHADKNGVLSGKNLLRARSAAEDALPNLRDADGIKVGDADSHKAALNSFNDVVQQTIDDHKSMGATGVVRDLENWQEQQKFKPTADALTANIASNKADRGAITPDRLAQKLPDTEPAQRISQDMNEVYGENPGAVTPSGRHFLHTVAPYSIGAGVIGHPGVALAGLGVNLAGNVAATKFVQKGLYGDHASQQAIAKALRNNPQAAHIAGYLGRQGVIDASR